jgi:shikimate kinase
MEESFEELISESEVPKILHENTENALSHIEKEYYESALKSLNNNEKLLEVVTTQGGIVDHEYIMVTIHNTALCYQK